MIDITCKRQQQTDSNHKCIAPSSQAAQTKQKGNKEDKGNKATHAQRMLQIQAQLITDDG
jgi:hypothetical protein